MNVRGRRSQTHRPADDRPRERTRRTLPLSVVLCVVAASALVACARLRAALPFRSGDAKAAAAQTPKPKRAGTLLLAGGGRTPGAVIAEAARLTGGAGTKMVVVPLASAAPDAGAAAVETWTHAGFLACELLDADDAAHAASQVDAATFVWMTGGDQSRLVGKLLDAGLVDRVRARFESGALVGGTSEGAAALSELMLAGEEKDDEMLQGRVDTVGGLGLWPGVIVDQHFVARRRFNRLMAAVIDHPQFVGVGIDEGTGVVVEGGSLRVVGDGNVVVIDARRAKVAPSRPGDASAATGVEMQVLSGGMTFDLTKR